MTFENCIIYTEGKKKRRVNILGDLILFIRMFFTILINNDKNTNLKAYFLPNRNFFIPKLLSISVLTFIKWRLTPSYVAKHTIFWQKRLKTIAIAIIVQDNKNSNIIIWPSMWTRFEHAHCLETINNMWFLGKREVDFDGFREKDE